MIKSIEMKNCATYTADAAIIENCQKVNFFYGPNGSGKSTISNFLYNQAAPQYASCKIKWENDTPTDIIVCNRDYRTRHFKRRYVTLNNSVFKYVEKLLSIYSFTQEPLKLDDPERIKMDVVKEIYNFYPSILIDEIGESDELSSLLELPKLIETYSNNPDNDTAYLFEEVLAEGFNMFYNVDANRIGGAGHTDIECLYITKKKKFAVESKSTANKLIGINVGRLREHREEIGGEYTIVVTPRYVPAAKRDIKGSQIVIILASTFAEYLYNHIFHDVRDIDYADFDDIIIDHLGKDVSKFISNMTMSKFAAKS